MMLRTNKNNRHFYVKNTIVPSSFIGISYRKYCLEIILPSVVNK